MSKAVVSKDTTKAVKRQSRLINARTIPLLATLAVWIILYAIGAVRYHDRNFFTMQVFIDFLVDNSFLGIVSVGMTMVVITGGIDLSVGGVVALCSVIMAKMMAGYHMSPACAWAIALGVGTIMGFFTGCAVRYFKIEPFIATLAGLFFARGLALVISTEAIDIQNKFVLGLSDVGLGCGPWFSVPQVVAVVMVAVGLIGLYLTPFGRALRAKGGKGVTKLMWAYIAAVVVIPTVLQLVGVGQWGVQVMKEQLWLPLPALVMLAVVALGVYITVFTAFGRNLFAIGGNEDAAHLMGLPVGRTKMLVYMLSGLLAGVAAIVMSIYQPSGDPIGANGMEMDAIAVAVIGGTLLTGGAGNVFGSFVGLLIFGMIQTGITMEGTLSSYWARVVIGALLLVFVVLQRFLSVGAHRKN